MRDVSCAPLPKVIVGVYSQVNLNDRRKMLGDVTRFTVIFFRDISLEMSELRVFWICGCPERFGSVDRHGWWCEERRIACNLNVKFIVNEEKGGWLGDCRY